VSSLQKDNLTRNKLATNMCSDCYAICGQLPQPKVCELELTRGVAKVAHEDHKKKIKGNRETSVNKVT
jgi:hypothetical protein